MEQSLGDIVKKARHISDMTQSQFAKSLGKSQGEVSKYETGTVRPPADIYIHCMNIIADKSNARSPSLDILLNELQLSGIDAPEHSMARRLIMGIIEGVRSEYGMVLIR